MFGGSRNGLLGTLDDINFGSFMGSYSIIGRFVFSCFSVLTGISSSSEQDNDHIKIYTLGNRMEKCSEYCSFKKDLSSINSIVDRGSLELTSSPSMKYFKIKCSKPIDYNLLMENSFGCFGSSVANFICSECASKANFLFDMDKKIKEGNFNSSYKLTGKDGSTYLLGKSDFSVCNLSKFMVSELMPNGEDQKTDSRISLFDIPFLASFEAFNENMNIEEERNPKE
ncbi:hypothetical protein PAEPH01_2313 [Pancytospora epiphaga]|nr:hypothetical protein PAEPH01_2313 [Pancytospora epiphaga]